MSRLAYDDQIRFPYRSSPGEFEILCGSGIPGGQFGLPPQAVQLETCHRKNREMTKRSSSRRKIPLSKNGAAASPAIEAWPDAYRVLRTRRPTPRVVGPQPLPRRAFRPLRNNPDRSSERDCQGARVHCVVMDSACRAS